MRAVKRKGKKRSIFLRVALAAFSIYVVVMLIQLQLEISKRQKKIDELDIASVLLQKEIEELEKQSENYEKYLEKKAREQGMARPGETIYIEIPGKNDRK
ncbi:MAG: septum formation initiator family protein [Oscillospiraceae bacterium]|jgi:cell division protein FtsB|nr:septum formation initiator family protein [Oscillospiraceae bacterium]